MKTTKRQLRSPSGSTSNLRDALYCRKPGDKARPVMLVRPTLRQIEVRVRNIERARRDAFAAPTLDLKRITAIAQARVSVSQYLASLS